MDKPQITMLAHTLKGPGLSCLFVMLGIDIAIGPNELSLLTNYDRKTISKGLEKLAALGLAVKQGRYDSWILTAKGYQLELLFVNPQKPGSPINSQTPQSREGELLPLGGGIITPPTRSSSSYINRDSINPNTSKQQQLQPNEGELLPLAELLVKQGCPRRTAQPAIEAALKRSEDKAHIERQITQWLVYCKSNEGEGIKSYPLFVAAKIKNGEPAPDIPEEIKKETIQWQT